MLKINWYQNREHEKIIFAWQHPSFKFLCGRTTLFMLNCNNWLLRPKLFIIVFSTWQYLKIDITFHANNCYVFIGQSEYQFSNFNKAVVSWKFIRILLLNIDKLEYFFIYRKQSAHMKIKPGTIYWFLLYMKIVTNIPFSFIA